MDRPLSLRLLETVQCYWDLGFTSFGGPGVHVVLLRRRFVDNLKWLDTTTFGDLFALGNALPGPGSTQLAFSIAVARNGTGAGLLAFMIWSLPASIAMAGLGAGVQHFPETLPPIVYGLLTGLNAAAVGLIALAAYQLSSASVTDTVTRLIVLGAASFGICHSTPWMYPVLVASGGIITLLFDYRLDLLHLLRRSVKPSPPTSLPTTTPNTDIELAVIPPAAEEGDKYGPSSGVVPELRSRGRPLTPEPSPPPAASPAVVSETHIRTPSPKVAIALGAVFVAVVITLAVLKARLANPPRVLEFFVNMVLAGVIIFGGGPVVIPLLKGYTVDPGWVNPRDFLLGFAILQAFPGPNFAFACFLGVLSVPSNPILGAFLGWVGIFAPGIILKLALLPVYGRWRRLRSVRSALRGLNAAASGLVYVAVWQLFLVGYIYKPVTPPASGSSTGSASGPLTADPWWGVVAASAFVASHKLGVYPAVAVLGGAAAGLGWYGVTSR